MINEEATGTVTVNGEKQSYDVEGGLFLPETVKEYEENPDSMLDVFHTSTEYSKQKIDPDS